MIVTFCAYLAQIAASISLGSHNVSVLFGLSVRHTVFGLWLWQPLTYMLLHAIDSPIHLLGNMFMLWMLGRTVEKHLGTRRFVKLYLLGGVFAALLTCLFYGVLGIWDQFYISVPVIGASGAICAVLAAFGTLFPEGNILLFFVIPMKVKHAILLIAGVELFITLSGTNSGIATSAHLGGMGFGYVFVRYGWAFHSILARLYRRRVSKRDESEEKVRERVDEILAKVNTDGMHSLSRRERSYLVRASKRFREPPR